MEQNHLNPHELDYWLNTPGKDVAKNLSGQTVGQIVGIDELQEVTRTSTELICSGEARLKRAISTQSITIWMVTSKDANGHFSYEYDLYAIPERLYSYSPTPTAPHFKLGLQYHEEKRFNAAIAEFTKELEIDSNSADSYYARGISYAELENHAKAIDDFSKSISITSDNNTHSKITVIPFYPYYNLIVLKRPIHQGRNPYDQLQKHQQSNQNFDQIYFYDMLCQAIYRLVLHCF